MPDNFSESDDNENMNLNHQEIPFLAENFVQQVDELISLAHYGPSIVLVFGEDGIGKTITTEQLDNETGDLGVIRIDGTPMLGVDQLHASFLQQLNSYQQAVEFNSVRDALLRASEETDQLILVDDAQQLSTSVLESLLSLVAPVEQSPTHLVRLFLFGNTDLEEQINISSYPQAAVYRLQLKGLNKDEIISFLGHKLHLSDANIEENYGQKQLNRLWQISQGNPGTLIGNLGEMGVDDELIENESNWSRIAFRAILTMLGIGLLVLAIFGEGWLPSTDEQKSVEDNNLIISEPIEEPLITQIEVSENNIDTVGKMEEVPSSVIEEFSEYKPLVSVELGENLDEEQAEADTATTENPENTETLTSETEEEIVTLEYKQNTTQSELNTVESTLTEASVEKETPLELPPVQIAEVTTVSELATNYTAEEQKLLEVPISHYSIQLVGLSKLDDMQKFVKELALEQETFIYRSLLNDQPWFILVTGDYMDADTARNEKNKLQASIKKLRPWIKSYSVIQQQIQEAAKNR